MFVGAIKTEWLLLPVTSNGKCTVLVYKERCDIQCTGI